MLNLPDDFGLGQIDKSSACRRQSDCQLTEQESLPQPASSSAFLSRCVQRRCQVLQVVCFVCSLFGAVAPVVAVLVVVVFQQVSAKKCLTDAQIFAQTSK